MEGHRRVLHYTYLIPFGFFFSKSMKKLIHNKMLWMKDESMWCMTHVAVPVKTDPAVKKLLHSVRVSSNSN